MIMDKEVINMSVPGEWYWDCECAEVEEGENGEEWEPGALMLLCSSMMDEPKSENR